MDLPSAVGAIPFLFLAQWLAVSTAEKKGLNPDNPKGLVSWVKL
jgi:fructoselysine-6-P-deglycase FrlB-like protein